MSVDRFYFELLSITIGLFTNKPGIFNPVLDTIVWSSMWIVEYIISVFDFLWNQLNYADCGKRHCKLQLPKVLVSSSNFFC